MFGNLRGSDNNWDRGAVEGDGAPGPSRVWDPSAADGLTVTTLPPVVMVGAIRCVLPDSVGRGDGVDWQNALGSNFTPARGATYFLGAGVYGAKRFIVGTSSDLMIILKKATATDHGPDVGWQDSYGGQAVFESLKFTTSNWILDGQTGGGPGAWVTGFGFKLEQRAAFSQFASSLCVLDGNLSNITFKQIHFNSDRVGQVHGIKAVTGAYSNITISRCAFTELFGINVHLANWSSSVVEHSYFFANRSTVDYPSAVVSAEGANPNCAWRWNLFDRAEGIGVLIGQYKGQSLGWRIYGNVFSRSCPPIYYTFEPDPSLNQNEMRDALILNNTVAFGTKSSLGSWIGLTGNSIALNNLFYRCDANSFSSNTKHDYTLAFGNIRSEGGFSKDAEIIINETQGRIGTEPVFSEEITNPLSSGFHAQTASGFDTRELIPENSRDMFGSQRGGDGVWDRGAVESGSGFVTQKPRPASNLRPL
jgi:hypothetical protein